MIQHISNNEGGGDVRAKLNEVIDLTNEVPNKVERLPTAQNGNVATWLNGALIDSGQTIGGGTAVNIPNWDDVKNDPLPLDFVVQFGGRLWVSKVEGNQNNQPPIDAEVTENEYWFETSESAAVGAPVWASGTYTKTLSEVFKLNTGDNIYYKYVLRAVVPFTSSDFDAELLAGDWQILAAESSIISAANVITTPTATLLSTNQEATNAELVLKIDTESYYVGAVNEKEYITRNYNFKVTKISATSGTITLLNSSGDAYTEGTTVTSNDYVTISGDTLNARLFIKIERV